MREKKTHRKKIVIRGLENKERKKQAGWMKAEIKVKMEYEEKCWAQKGVKEKKDLYKEGYKKRHKKMDETEEKVKKRNGRQQ